MDIIYYKIHFVSSKYYLYCRYVLTIVDYMSKWPEAYPIFTKSAQEVASKIENTGVCQEIISDCGSQTWGQLHSNVIDYITITLQFS